jgi:hypothetical protein
LLGKSAVCQAPLSRSSADQQGILAGVPFFEEVFKYAGCT